MANPLVKIQQTPKGELEWCNIRGEGRADPQGRMKYQASIVLDPDNNPEHAAFIAKVDEFWKDNKPKGVSKAKSTGIYNHTKLTGEKDEDGNNIYEETGLKVAVFKTATSFPDGKAKVVKVYNAKAKEVAVGDDFKIGNGSIGRISGAMAIYTVGAQKVNQAGVTLYLDAVMVSKLEKYVDGPSFSADEAADDEDGWDGDAGTFTGDDEEGSTESAESPKPRL